MQSVFRITKAPNIGGLVATVEELEHFARVSVQRIATLRGFFASPQVFHQVSGQESWLHEHP